MYPFGVNVFGFLKGEFGLGEAARLTAKALKKNDVPISLVNFESKIPHRCEDTTFSASEYEVEEYAINLIQINPQSIDEFLTHPLDYKKYLKGKYNIAYWAWELLDFPDEHVKYFSLFDEIWTPSNYCVEAISQKSSIPVLKFSHPVTENTSSLGREDLDLPKDKFIILTFFDYHSSINRKNPLAVVEAFKKAFGEDEKVLLVIKTSDDRKFPKESSMLKQAIGNLANIKIINKVISKEEVEGLMKNCDCLISLHRSEGFGLTMAEAMSVQKPVVATYYSGNTDFMNINNSFPVQYKLVSLENDYALYKKGNTWADANVDHASELLKKVVYNLEETAIIAKKGWEDIWADLSLEAVGAKMKKRLELINSKLIPEKTNSEIRQKIVTFEAENRELVKRVHYLEKSLYNKIRKKVNRFFSKLRGEK